MHHRSCCSGESTHFSYAMLVQPAEMAAGSHLRDLPALVVAPDERDAVGVPHLHKRQHASSLGTTGLAEPA